VERLPAVTREVAAAVRGELLASQGNDYAVGILQRLEKDNPELAQFIALFSQTQANPAGVATGAVLVYRLLESQLDADRLNREFGV
jgi:hypothetical protein